MQMKTRHCVEEFLMFYLDFRTNKSKKNKKKRRKGRRAKRRRKRKRKGKSKQQDPHYHQGFV